MSTFQHRRSRSAIALANVGATQVEIAERIHVSQPSVSAYLAASKKPNPVVRARIAEEWASVTVGGWDVYPTDVAAKVTHAVVSKPQRPSAPRPLVPAPEAPPPLPTSEPGTTIAEVVGGPIGQAVQLSQLVHRALAELRAELDRPDDDRTMPRAELSKHMARLASCVERVAKLTGDHDLSRRVLDLPRWKEMRATLEAALEPYPDAARAVGDALMGLHEYRVRDGRVPRKA